MILNAYWRGCIEAGPIEPPLTTYAYLRAEMEFNVWSVEWELGERLLTVLSPLVAEMKRVLA